MRVELNIEADTLADAFSELPYDERIELLDLMLERSSPWDIAECVCTFDSSAIEIIVDRLVRQLGRQS